MSITIKDFGWRLGNQLFQLAAAITLADENYDDVAFPEWKYSQCFYGDFTPKESLVSSIYTEPEFAYNKIPYRRNMAISGYFQSYKYWRNNKKKIQQMFKPKLEPYVFDNEETCAIHYRVGDYKSYPDHHPILTKDYYDSAIEMVINKVGNNVGFYVFSDNKNAAKEMFTNSKCTIMNTNDFESYSAMYQCKHFIIGNSSFSLFPSLLKDGGIRVAPKSERWFGPALRLHNLKDLIPDDWIRL